MTTDELRDHVRGRMGTMPLREWCRLTGCTVSHVHEFIKGKRGPPNDLLAYLNMRVNYVRNRKAPQ